MAAALSPDERVTIERVTMLVPVGGDGLDGPGELLPGLEAPPLERLRAEGLPPRLVNLADAPLAFYVLRAALVVDRPIA
jgi:hypothetical protein